MELFGTVHRDNLGDFSDQNLPVSIQYIEQCLQGLFGKKPMTQPPPPHHVYIS